MNFQKVINLPGGSLWVKEVTTVTCRGRVTVELIMDGEFTEEGWRAFCGEKPGRAEVVTLKLRDHL